eukprot:TRINITY_DN2254_c0_g1_i1.p1 TRINITY_DN2254_c0_g1~~TRINITY_DN2254_c0_g1_i1.p1  ORF type:complete len:223 (-),score=74.41 TRINITY_DN2254_c0_g1_i1:48-716(-)
MLAVDYSLPLERFDIRPKGKRGFRTGASLTSAKSKNSTNYVAVDDAKIEDGKVVIERFTPSKQKQWQEVETPSVKIKQTKVVPVDTPLEPPRIPKKNLFETVYEKAEEQRRRNQSDEEEEEKESDFKLVKTRSGTTVVPKRSKGKTGVKKAQERAARRAELFKEEAADNEDVEEEEVELRVVYKLKNPKQQVMKSRYNDRLDNGKEPRSKTKKELLILNTFV